MDRIFLSTHFKAGFQRLFAVGKDSLALDLPEALVGVRCENVAIALVFVNMTGINSSCKVPQLKQAGYFPYICGKSSPHYIIIRLDKFFRLNLELPTLTKEIS